MIPYDKTSPKSIEKYSKKLIGMSFRDVIEQDTQSTRDEHKANKGNLGEIIEESFFHYECNGNSAPDFEEAGVELKVTPYKIGKTGEKVAKERLILTMIDYFQVAHEYRLEESHLWYKCNLMLLIFYLYNEAINYRLDYKIGYSKLFTPPERDLKIIRQDFIYITDKVRKGLAHELSEGDTLYLGACTKASKGTDRRTQPFNAIEAKPRAFSFKNSYMTYVLNHYIISDVDTYEPIVTEETEETFEEYVVRKINAYKGYSLTELCTLFDPRPDKVVSKSLVATITYKILGIKGNHAEEFEKAGIVIKTIRTHKKGIKESMSFPAFKFKELVLETWDDSTFGNYLRETKFLFVVFSFGEDNKELYLRGCQFWNMPYKDLEQDVKKVWERTQQVIRQGIRKEMRGGRMVNNLPKMSESRVCHVRPHAKNAQDTYELPDGSQFPKQCFWLNSDYIYDQLNDNLK